MNEPKKARGVRGCKPRVSSDETVPRMITWRTNGLLHHKVAEAAKRQNVAINTLLTTIIEGWLSEQGQSNG